MELIQLEKTPNQSFSVTLGENNYEIRIYSIDNNHVSYDITINDALVISGFKLTNSVLLLPYQYQEVNGNLILVISSEELPDYSRFGDSQFLYYLDAQETAEYRNVFDIGI